MHFPLRILIVDDHAMFRKSLRFYLQTLETVVIVGEARNGREAVECSTTLQPDFIIMDVRMPLLDGITATRLIRNHHPHVQVMILTSFIQAESIEATLTAGAVACLDKNTSIESIGAVIEQFIFDQASK